MSAKHMNSTLNHEPMYNPDLLKQLDFSESPTQFNPPVTAVQPGEFLCVRPLCTADYEKGFIQLLGQLTDVGQITKEQFLRRYAEMKSCPDTYYTTVIEDTLQNKIIGAATLVVEQKFIHGCGKRGRLEDVVVNNTYRGKQLGKLIVTTIALLAKVLNCYKITLECKDNLIPFYQSIGYVLEPGLWKLSHFYRRTCIVIRLLLTAKINSFPFMKVCPMLLNLEMQTT